MCDSEEPLKLQEGKRYFQIFKRDGVLIALPRHVFQEFKQSQHPSDEEYWVERQGDLSGQGFEQVKIGEERNIQGVVFNYCIKADTAKEAVVKATKEIQRQIDSLLEQLCALGWHQGSPLSIRPSPLVAPHTALRKNGSVD